MNHAAADRWKRGLVSVPVGDPTPHSGMYAVPRVSDRDLSSRLVQ